MKKIIAASIVLLAFSLNATAQNKQTSVAPVKNEMTLMTPEVAVQKNISDLSSVITVSPEMKSILTGLFLTKFRMLSSNPSAENKKYVSEIIERKLEATLDGPSFKKIRENETLFKSLVN